MYQGDENVNFFLEEIQENNDVFDINAYNFSCDNDYHENDNDVDLNMSMIMHYNDNFTIKELMVICEYYGISKELKANKCKKEIIIHFLLDFECNPLNDEIVSKRKNLWFYINELKNDKFMKKYVVW